MGAITGLISSVAQAAGRFDEERCGRTRRLGQPCVCSLHSKCQTATRVRSFSRRDCVRGLRSRTILVTTGLDPVVHADCGSERPNRLAPIEPFFRMDCRVKPGKDEQQKKREAKRRKTHAIQCPHRSSQRGGGVEAIHRRQACAVCATYLLAAFARLPALRCGACPGERTPGLSPGRASRETRCEGVTSA